MPDLLFEIGTEELPPSLIDSLCFQIKENLKKSLNEFNILTNDNNFKTFTTPRRLAFLIQGLPKSQKLKTEEIKGPSVDKAFDMNGNSTEALNGFSKKYSLNPKELIRKKVNNIEYLFASVQTGGKEIKDVLKQVLPKAMLETTGTKFMRWGNYEEKFSRPVRWIVAIIDSEIISFSYAGIESSNYTFGHRILSNKKIIINHPLKYEETLEVNYIISLKDKRKEKIKKLLNEEGNKINGIPIIDESLLEEVTNLTEYPNSLVGSFDSEFLSLPSCIIITVLNSHQKNFALLDKNNKDKLLPNFITIINTKNQTSNEIKKSNEKVVRAKLKDAQFFYKEDLKISFNYNTRKKELSKITFHKGLGSIDDKVQRICKLSEFIYNNIENKETLNIKDLLDTVYHCKLDLTTHMVFEFTELQGEIGMVYATKNNLNQTVAKGILEHYFPRFTGDKLPETLNGIIVGIADKIDNITCLFAINKIPTGSADPFALRRQAQGIIENIIYKNLRIDLSNLILFHKNQVLVKNVKEKIDEKKENQIKDFLLQRFINYMQEKGYEIDLISSVVSTGNSLNDIIATKERIEVLKNLFLLNEREKLKPFLVAAKRLVRIVESNHESKINKEDLITTYEKELFQKFEIINNKQYKTYKEFIYELSTLTESINTFFDHVLVNDPDPKIKKTRQSLLKFGKDLFERVCDFNQILER